MEMVAAREGISLQEVEKNIELAITEAIRSCKENDDQQALKFWNQLSMGKEQPSPEKLISVLCSYIKNLH